MGVRAAEADHGVGLPDHALAGIGVVLEQPQGGGPKIMRNPRHGLDVVGPVFGNRDAVTCVAFREDTQSAAKKVSRAGSRMTSSD